MHATVLRSDRCADLNFVLPMSNFSSPSSYVSLFHSLSPSVADRLGSADSGLQGCIERSDIDKGFVLTEQVLIGRLLL